MSVTLKCSTEASPPQFESYDGKEVKIDWSSPAGCSFSEPGGGSGGGKPSEDTEEGDAPEPEKVGSGVGYFFLLYVLPRLLAASVHSQSGIQVVPCICCLLWPRRILQLLNIWCIRHRPYTVRGNFNVVVLYSLIPVPKLADTETFGEKFLICYATSSPTYAQPSDHDTPATGAGTLQYDSTLRVLPLLFSAG